MERSKSGGVGCGGGGGKKLGSGRTEEANEAGSDLKSREMRWTWGGKMREADGSAVGRKKMEG